MKILFLALFSLAQPKMKMNLYSPGYTGTNQIIWVEPTNTFQTKLRMIERKGRIWSDIETFPVVIGKNGFASVKKKKEGDGKTPIGVYEIKRAMGIPKTYDTKLKYTQITDGHKWVDDPKSPDYNKLIEGPTKAKTFEPMLRTDGLYDLLAVVEFNTEKRIPNKGSAIFAHIWRGPDKPTAGCVAMEKEKIEKILRWLDPAHKPKIIFAED